MNIYTILLVFPLTCAPNSCVLIDGHMSIEVQIIKDNNDRRQMFTETGQEKRKKEEKGTLTERKRKLFKEIYENETDQTTANKEIKEKDKTRGDEKGRHHVVTEKLIDRERYTTEERKVNGKGPINQTESTKKLMTTAVHLECVYQYPERNQMEALLGDMMHQLTRLIVSAHEYSESDVGNVGNIADIGNVGNTSDMGNVGNTSDLDNVDNTSDVDKVGNKSDMGNVGKTSDLDNVDNTSDVDKVGNKSDMGNVGKTSDLDNVDNTSDVDKVGNTSDVGTVDYRSDVNDTSDAGGRRLDKRFRVVSERGPAVFEGVFKLLTHQYQKFYNTTLHSINRTSDPCEHQPEIKRMWHELLAQSQDLLRRSTLSAAEQLFPRTRADDSRQQRLGTMLARQLPRIRSELLESLCEGFQLCYSDLL